MSEKKQSRVEFLAEFDKLMRWRTVKPREKVERDRSLRGKTRRLARKSLQRYEKNRQANIDALPPE